MKVILIMVATADGIIANEAHENSFTWNSQEDKKQFQELSMNIKYNIMGSTTFLSSGGKPLKNRHSIVLTSDPSKFEQMEDCEFVNMSAKEVYDMLAGRGLEQVALIGGARVNAQFLEAALVDEIYLTVEPKLFGEGKHISEGKNFDVELKLLDSRQLNEQGTILLHYQVIKQ